MPNILIIGAGQLGSRHLQGAVQSRLALNIVVVDPSVEALKIAESRANEITFGNVKTSVQFIVNVEQGKAIDICIIATTANVRYKVFQDLISKCTVKNIIFEKVLFQKEKEYLEVEELLVAKDIKAWVNCPRRIFSAYQQIHTLLADERELRMAVAGSNWGLACNGIHFIDLFAYLTGNCDYQLDCSKLNEQLIVSKRSGFYEVNGTLIGKVDNANSFELRSLDDEGITVEVHIVTPNFDIFVKETLGGIIIGHKGEERKESYNPLYQSQLTHLNIEEIINTGDSSLTNFADSKKIHLPFIRSLKQHIENSLNEKLVTCPIT
jgi:predicted dehydrogenase